MNLVQDKSFFFKNQEKNGNNRYIKIINKQISTGKKKKKTIQM